MPKSGTAFFGRASIEDIHNGDKPMTTMTTATELLTDEMLARFDSRAATYDRETGSSTRTGTSFANRAT